IGTFKQPVSGSCMQGTGGNTHGERRGQIPIVEPHFQPGKGQADGIGPLYRCSDRYFRHQYDELLAAIAADDVAAATVAGQPSRQSGQYLIPGLLAELVVDALEMLDIDQQPAEIAVGLAVHHSVEQLSVQMTAIVEPGERVAMGQLTELDLQRVDLLQLAL